MSRPLAMRPVVESGEERDFYLDEFRGRSVLIAIGPEVVAERADLAPIAATVADLVRNDTRVVLWWPSKGVATDRRLTAALVRSRAIVRRRGPRRRPLPVVRVRLESGVEQVDETLRADLWEHLRQGRLCVLAANGRSVFPGHALALAAALRIPKLVLVDPQGGLATGTGRLSFVDENVLETVLRDGEAEWSGLGDRRELLVAVQDALGGGVEAVNLCSPAGIAEELFSYEGSGTLFTQGDYCRVAPLGLDDFAQAERLLDRGQREGVLKLRTREEIADVLAGGFGAMISGRHLAGVAGLLVAPYVADRAGEIVGLYTITRFKGEGIGERLVTACVTEADRRGLASVFACAVDARAQQFFERLGFVRVRPQDVPAAKWIGYDARRRSRVAVYRIPVGGAVAATTRR